MYWYDKYIEKKVTCWNKCMMYDLWKTFSLPHEYVCTVLISWPENVRRVTKILWSFLKHCYILLNFVLFYSSSWQSVTISIKHSCHYRTRKKIILIFCFGLYAQFRWSTSYQLNLLSINKNGYFHGMYVLCKCTISLTQFTSFFQFAGEMSNSHMYKFFQNNLYSYNMIANSLRKIHISENRDRNNCSEIVIPR
jgi:hypothetical protein